MKPTSNGHGPHDRVLESHMIATWPERKAWQISTDDDLAQQLAVREERLRFLSLLDCDDLDES